MKQIVCYLRTLKEIDVFLMALIQFGALYVAHDYVEQKPEIRGNREYSILKCQTCGHLNEAYRQF